MKLLITNLLTLVFTILLSSVSSKISCIGKDGKPVDMYVLYKLPRINWYQTPDLIYNGTAYAYLDSEDTIFRLSEFSIDSVESAAGKTLNQVYKKYEDWKVPTDQAHVFYNDAFNGTEFWDNGHTKGAIAFDTESGFWLIHSVPKFPAKSVDGYSYPSSGHKYGQMFMCVTFKSDEMDKIGMQLRFNNAHVHDSNLPKNMADNFPNISKLIQGEMITTAPYSSVIELESANGVGYTSFAKSTDFDNDLYSDLVAPTLQTDLLTETWQIDEEHTKNIGPSCDGEYTVEDISNITIQFQDQTQYDFHNNNDHSKFVVGKTEPYICVGDINRQKTQFRRGGGTLCTKYNEELDNEFHGLIKDIISCDDNPQEYDNDDEKHETKHEFVRDIEHDEF